MYKGLKWLSIFLISMSSITSCNNVNPSNIQKVEHNNNNKLLFNFVNNKIFHVVNLVQT